jgi:uncharacterized protein
VKRDFRARYGPWAVVAGGSEGLGAAFAGALAARGLSLVLLANEAGPLDTCAAALESRHGIAVRKLLCDLGQPGFADALREAMKDIEVGLGVYNAAYSFVAPLFERPLEEALRVIDVNCTGPIRFAHVVVPPMLGRGRGGLVFMSSLAGMQGTPRLSAYAASKAFNIVLAESLWSELSQKGIDVVAPCAGAIRTPNYEQASRTRAPGTLEAADVAEQALDALGHGPRVVPGTTNKLIAFMMSRLLSRTRAIRIMEKSTRDLQQPRSGPPT